MATRQKSNLLSLDTPDATGAATTMVKNTLPSGTTYTYEGRSYTGGHPADPNQKRPAIPASPSIPRKLAIRHAYEQQRTEALAGGTDPATIPSLRTVLQTDHSSLLGGGEGVMPELEVVSGPDPAEAARQAMEALRTGESTPEASTPAEAAEGQGSTPADPSNAAPPPSDENPADGTGQGVDRSGETAPPASGTSASGDDTPPAGDGTEDDGAVGTGPAADEDALEPDFPHVGKLNANGVNTYGQLRKAMESETVVDDLKGIGEKRLPEIQEVLAKRAPSA